MLLLKNGLFETVCPFCLSNLGPNDVVFQNDLENSFFFPWQIPDPATMKQVDKNFAFCEMIFTQRGSFNTHMKTFTLVRNQSAAQSVTKISLKQGII